MTAIVVDWLGRGGIAQCTNAWVKTAQESGRDVRVVTVAGREISGAHVHGVADEHDRITRHRHLARSAAELILKERPTTVIVQNYVIPLFESPVARAANKVGAKLIWVIHNQQAHSLVGGTTVGLRPNLRRSDVVVAHSHFVAERIPGDHHIVVMPLPIPPDYEPSPSDKPLFPAPDDGLLALHFGVLKRTYKGTSVVAALSEHLGPGSPWTVAVVGVGAPPSTGRLLSHGGFVPSGRLAATVASAQATLLPYAAATQSAAVTLAQSRGSVPIASAVGGIPEQIDDGATGLLLPAGAGVGDWVAALERLEPTSTREAMSGACVAKSALDHSRFTETVRSLVRS